MGMWLAAGLSRRGYDVLLLTAEYSDELYGSRGQLGFQLVEIGGPGYGNSGLAEMLQLGRRLSGFLRACDVVVASNYPTYQWVYFSRQGCRRFPPVLWMCQEPPRVLYDREFNEHSYGILPLESVGDRLGRWIQEEGIVQTLIRRPGLLLPGALVQVIQRVVDRRAVRSVDQIVCNSAFTAERTARIYRRQDIAICHLGIPEPVFADLEPPKSPYLLTVSPLQRIKNVETIIRAVHRLFLDGQFTGCKYVIVGDGYDRLRLGHLVAGLGLQDIVEFRGFIGDSTDDGLERLYHQANVIAYLPFDEPFGLVFVEAAAHSKPVIAPNQGGAPEIVVDGKTGFLVDPTDVDGVAEALLRLLRDGALAECLGRAGQARFRERFTVDAFLDRFETVMKDRLLKTRPSS